MVVTISDRDCIKKFNKSMWYSGWEYSLLPKPTDCASDDILNGEIPIQRVRNKYLPPPQSEQQIYNKSFPGGSPDNPHPMAAAGNSSKGRFIHKSHIRDRRTFCHVTRVVGRVVSFQVHWVHKYSSKFQASSSKFQASSIMEYTNKVTYIVSKLKTFQSSFWSGIKLIRI